MTHFERECGICCLLLHVCLIDFWDFIGAVLIGFAVVLVM
jgi:hypothetical protein